MDDDYDPSVGLQQNGVEKKSKGGKRLSVERIYQKKSQLEHILLRPDTYIGSVQPVTEKMWVLDEDENSKKIVSREITYVPGFYKIFDEILVNAADNKQRDKKMDTIKIDIKPEEGMIRVFNNGKGIPVEMHQDEKMYVPTMIFGHLLTSSNFDDNDQKVTGGRNGFGAKLCNVFSNKFTVETSCKEYKKEFKQTWTNNMSKANDAKIKPAAEKDFTRITYYPDLSKFNMTSIDRDIVALLSRRAYDIAASTLGAVKVYLNGTKIPIKGFKDYVDMYLKDQTDETGQAIKCHYESCGERWQVAVAPSSDGFQQMSFVNSIATTKGGRHVDHVSKLVNDALVDQIKKKNKSGVQIKPHQIKNHLWLFVNCLITNPTFDSQTKETMTSQQNAFGSKCVITDKFKGQIVKTGIVESVLAWSKFKQDQQKGSKLSAKKTNKIKGISKLEDANNAGTRNSLDCTLVLTEGDSAKSMAVAGVGAVEKGRDIFGVYPLKGKLLNVREASHKQIMENKEINELVKIVGLQYKKKYDTVDDLKTLRYGKVMIMTDQDQDGSHIKGLLINFVHHNWPGLLRLPFLEEFITPIVKVTKGERSLCFYSLPEFTEWKAETTNWNTWKVKYYKGLGTSTSKEAKEYFSDMVRHRIKFTYQNEMDDHAINLAFSKKMIEQRKDWLTSWMEECKRREDLGLSEIYLYEKNTRSVTYSDFVNKELVLFSNCDNERSIPSLVDGFKPGQRKVMFTCFKRNDKKEVKVAQLAGSVGEKSAYHHGEMSLVGTIINLAQDFIGSNNINLLLPNGQFGTRLQGGKDHASARYIFTQMSPLARHIFNPQDDPILKYLQDDNQLVEPQWYIPIIPMVLVNGADGIGTGWATKIPNYNPREIVQMIFDMLDGKNIEELKPLIPWFKGFKGSIEPLDYQRYVCNGEISELSDTKVAITELPIKTWTSNYKEMLEGMQNGSEKQKPQITEYSNYSGDYDVHFEVAMTHEEKRKAEVDKGLHNFFKLQTTLTTTSMVLFDRYGCMKKYDDVRYIMQEFYDVRLEFYAKRKKHLEGMLGAEALKLSNQARFIIEKCDGSLVVENKKRKKMIEELVKRNYDSDPVKKWKSTQTQQMEDSQDQDQENPEPRSDDENETQEESKGPDYDYLLGMAMWSLTLERKEKLLREKQEKHQELENLKATSKEDLWRRDLKEFVKKLDEFEQKQLDNLKVVPKKGGKKNWLKKENAPVADTGIRVVPQISDDLKKKASAAVKEKEKKESKKVSKNDAQNIKDELDDFDEFDAMADAKVENRSLSDRLGLSGEKKKKKIAEAPPSKITNYFTKTKDEVESNSNSDDDSDVQPVLQPDKKVSRPRKLLDAGGSDDSDFGNTAAKLKKKVKSSDEKPPAPKKAKVVASKVQATKKSKNAFESSDEESVKSKVLPTKAKKVKAARNVYSSEEGSGSDFVVKDDDSDFASVPARERPGRARKTVSNYNYGDSSESDFA